MVYVLLGRLSREDLAGTHSLTVIYLTLHVAVQVSKMNKDAQMRAAINQKLIETGERER